MTDPDFNKNLNSQNLYEGKQLNKLKQGEK